ncbi:ABC transporter ATP-binding protein [Streptomyces radicis]|uniref:ABC transporter ATP-binding protein n=1 Tax=Streptomyces radicis TaxID=1750517 RepID=A0A3A9WF46_9ACTN|nr:ABC transporter ATP-binding protein [Streptomyces radicis]RKN11635.1 ABC transporter ATP-binding protein [Streptomyces radicis]RKN26821.1 ABC transporter ATP-binding protein [Streptomyces radicis]
MIDVRGLRRRYGPRGEGGFDAVRGLDFSVRGGEVFALLGTNGAGKTSTVEVLEGLAPPTEGTVRVMGRDPYRERAEVRRHTGVMLQEGGFPSDLTVAETARMWADSLTAARPVAEALDLVDLGHRATVRVKQLSGGERRRLDLALALAGRPRVLFLDEPTTGLDPQARHTTWQLVQQLRDEGATILLTTHYLEEAETLADRLAIMRAGQIVLAGTPGEVTAALPSRIRFTLPDGVDPAVLPVGGAVVRGQEIEFETPDLQTSLTDLLVWARDRRLELGGIDARSASLEDVFLAVAEEAR